MKTYYTPKTFSKDGIPAFLLEVQDIFGAENRKLPKVGLSLHRTRKIDIVGILLLYKFMDYTLKHNVFQNPSIYMQNTYLSSVIDDFGCSELINSLINNNQLKNKDYKTLTLKEHQNFILAPQALLRNEDIGHSLSTKYMPNIKAYYQDEKVVSMIFHCFSEITLNFWAHASEDDKSIIMAKGNKREVEIACVDNGCGIISSLTSILPDKKASKILESAFKKNITSKPNTNHMGCGLWIIKELCDRAKGEIEVFSEGHMIRIKNGKINVESCGYWKGTIFYLYLPTNNPATPADILPKHEHIIDIFN